MLDLDLVREHLKADVEDVEEELLEQYVSSATSICANYCNRALYEDEDARAEDYTAAITEYGQLKTARETALNGVTDCDLRNMIVDTYIQKFAAVKRRIVGIAVDDTIRAAILMTVGFVYVQREDVTRDNIPMGVRRILEPYLWIGDLAG